MTSETVYSVELVSRMTYLSANSLRGTYTGTLRRNVPSLPVTTGECPFSVPLTVFVSVLRAAGLESLPAEGLVWEDGRHARHASKVSVTARIRRVIYSIS